MALPDHQGRDLEGIMPNSDDGNEDIIVQLPNGIGVRRYRQSDVTSLSRHGNNKKIWNNLRNRMPNPYLEEHAKWWIDRTNDPSNFVPSGPWTAETSSQGPLIPSNYTVTIDDEAVGSIGLEFGDASDVYARTAEIGYWLGEEHWGKGVMSKVVPAFVEWTWGTFGILVRLNAETYERNMGSRRCLEKAGFEVEGRRRWAFLKNGVIGNDAFMGALRPGGVEGSAVEDT